MSVTKLSKGYKVRYRDHAGNAKAETYDKKADADARDAAIRQRSSARNRSRREVEELPGRRSSGSRSMSGGSKT